MNIFGSTLQLLIVWCAVNVGAENVEIVTPENTKILTEPPNVTTQPPDSYIKAYEEAQKLRSGPAKRNDYNDPQDKDRDKQAPYNTVIRSSYLSDDRYPPITEHWAPMHAPAPPPMTHGPPMDTYGPPYAHHFHDTALPTHCHHPIPYSSPSPSFFGFLPKKLSLKLLLKILLKLVLFKMIVKFIAVICLLLFIPLLKVKGSSADGDGDERRRARDLDAMSTLIWNVLEHKNSIYGDMDDEDVKDIKDIAEEDDQEEENIFSGPLKAVRFLEFCVSVVNRAVTYILGSIKNERSGEDDEDITSFLFES